LSQPALRLCSRDGHDWTDAPDAAIVSRRCVHCPAIGVRCPDCDGHGIAEIGDRLPECVRCDGTGTVEVVEIAHQAVERLRANHARFMWLLAEYSHTSNVKASAAIREIDALIGMGASCGKIRGRPIADVVRDERRKKTPGQEHDRGR
jgi:RecJ-like exonuclease